MKTKHILTALALPAMFAACTADDIVSESNGLQQQEQRAKLSKDFVLKVNNEVESRYAVEGTTGLKFVFEEGDKIGANIIDAYTDRIDDELSFDKKDPATWEIVNYIAPALPFINEGGVWKSANEELGIGNYLFTNPFNPADKSRAAASYELPVVVQYSSENPNAHIEEYNKAVAAQIMYEGQAEANVSLKNIFAYPKIRINFKKDLEVKKVTKVILAQAYVDEETNEKKYGEFIYKGAFNHKDVADMFNPKKIEAWLKADKKRTEEDYWDQFQTSNFIIDVADADIDGNGTDETTIEEVIEAAKNFADIKTTPYFIYEMDETVESNSIEVRFIIPSIASLEELEIGDEERITMYVCTDKGNFEMELTDLDNYQFSATTLASKKYAAMQRNTSNTLKTKALTEANESDDDFFVDNIVSTAADWNALVEKYGDLKRYSAEYKKEQGWTPETAGDNDAAELVVTILDDDFALTADLEMPEVAEFVIKSEVGVEGAVTLKNIKMDGAALVVKKGATLTTDPTLVAPTVNVEKGGNLLFAAEYDEDEKLVAYDGITTAVNHGTVTVPAGVIAQFELQNADRGAVLNVGAETRAAAAEAVANIYGWNSGTINNYSVVNVVEEIEDEEQTFTNNAPSDDEEVGYEWDTEEKKWDGAPTINNFGKWNATGETVNNGLFEQKGELSSNFVGNASFTNTTFEKETKAEAESEAAEDKSYRATLKIAKNAKTYIDSNKGGEIVLSELEPADFTIHKAKKAEQYSNEDYGTIKYFLNDKSNNKVELKNSPVTELETSVGIQLASTWTYTDKDGKTQVVALDKLVVNGGEVEIAERTGANTTEDPFVYTAHVTKMLIKSGDVLIAETVNAVDEIEIAAGATLGVPVSTVLSVKNLNAITTGTEAEIDGKEVDEGELIVNGEFNLWDVSGNKDGIYGTISGDDYTWTNTGTGNITLHKGVMITAKPNDTTASDTAKALQTLYNNALATIWSDYGATIDNKNNYDFTEIYGYNPTNKEWMASEIVRAYREVGKVPALMTKLYGDALATYDALATSEKKIESLMSKLDDGNFAAAVTNTIYWTTKKQWGNENYTDAEFANAKNEFKALFFDAESGKFDESAKAEVVQSDVVYETENGAYESVLAAFHKPANNSDFFKYANVWQYFGASDVKTALLHKDAGKFGDVEGKYVFVWKGCDLDKVVAEMNKYSAADWAAAYPKNLGECDTNEALYTIEGVRAFLKAGAMEKSTSPVVDAAEIAKTYYSASQTWGYSDDQVAALTNARKVVVIAGTGE